MELLNQRDATVAWQVPPIITLSNSYPHEECAKPINFIPSSRQLKSKVSKNVNLLKWATLAVIKIDEEKLLFDVFKETPMTEHDLVDFMKSATREMNEDYTRIRKRAKEDPGTAGDQGEENWATLFRKWLLPTFHIVTKGRILSQSGQASPQVDVIVLQPEYPKHLLGNKLYLAGGVIAVFECKITLKAIHIQEFFDNCVEMKTKLPIERGTPFKELHSTIIYGLLSHSHSWKADKSTVIENISKKIYETDKSTITHPKYMPDIVCVADLNTWHCSKTVLMEMRLPYYNAETSSITYGAASKVATTLYSNSDDLSPVYTPIGATINFLMTKIAWRYTNLRSLATYFSGTSIQGARQGGRIRTWNAEIYSKLVKEQVESENNWSSLEDWDEWNFTF